MTYNNLALKEWNIAVNSLAQGEMILLLRKGGIKELEKSFKLTHEKFWLYPTFEHQKSELLKENYRHLVTEVESGWHPETVEIKAQAQVTDTFLLDDFNIINQLSPYHIWSEEFINLRLKFKPQNLLHIILVRVYKLEKFITIPYRQEYSGCKSWINLLEEISAVNLSPVLTDREYQDRVTILQQLMRS